MRMYAYASIQKGMQWKDKPHLGWWLPMGKDKDSDPIGEGYVVGFSCVCNLHFLN